jgi:hypothetical protein
VAEPRTPSQRVRDLYSNHIKFWNPYREARRKEAEFLEGDRYKNDHGVYNKDRRLIQIRGQETQDTIRHVVGRATEKPRTVEARPVDIDTDPDTGEVAASLVEWELSNPWKGFEDCFEEALIDSRERRIGLVWMDWDPTCGPYGEILYRFADASRFMWDPSYHPHHPKCDWLIEEKRLNVDLARETYKAPWLEPDRGMFSPAGSIQPGTPILENPGGDRIAGTASDYRDDQVTLWLAWFKNDRTKAKQKKEVDYLELKPDDRYLSCVSGCGYRSPTQGELRIKDQVREELPELVPGGCPVCSGDLDRIDATSEAAETLAYSRGRRLTIVSPFCRRSGDEDAVYDGKWPIPTARSFPLLVLTAYAKPGFPMGPSDTTLMWDQQIASDQLRTMAIQRVFEHRNFWVLPRAGIVDHKNKRYMMRDDQSNVMYRDASVMGPLDIQMFNGTGLDPSFPVVFGIAQQALVQYRGVADMGLTQENSKDIAASTVSQLTQMGEIPVAHYNRRKNRELSKFYGVLWDYIRATYTAERIARLRIEGTDVVANLSGDDLPNFDFAIYDTPPFVGSDRAKTDAFQALVQFATNPMTQPFLDIFAEVNELPRSVVRKIEKRLKELSAMPQPPPESAGKTQGAGAPKQMAETGNGASMGLSPVQ